MILLETSKLLNGVDMYIHIPHNLSRSVYVEVCGLLNAISFSQNATSQTVAFCT